MRPLRVVQVKILRQPLLQFHRRAVAFQVEVFVLDAPPEPFDEDVIQRPAASVHADADCFMLLEYANKYVTGKLRPLIAVEDFRHAVLSKRLFETFRAKTAFHRVRQPPRHARPRRRLRAGGGRAVASRIHAPLPQRLPAVGLPALRIGLPRTANARRMGDESRTRPHRPPRHRTRIPRLPRLRRIARRRHEHGGPQSLGRISTNPPETLDATVHRRSESRREAGLLSDAGRVDGERAGGMIGSEMMQRSRAVETII